MGKTAMPPLYSVPPEIFLSICAHLSEPDLHSLKLSSPHLRQLVTSHAASLCNAWISARYPREAALLKSKVKDGWLVPTHPCVLGEEAQVRIRHRHQRSKSSSMTVSASSFGTNTSSISSSRSRSCDTSPLSSWSSGVSAAGTLFAAAPHVRLDLSTPGPEYLRFLTEYSFEIRVAEEMFLARRGKETPNPPQPKQSPSPRPSRARDSDLRLGSPKKGAVVVQYDKLGLRDQPTPQVEQFGSWVALYCVRRFLDRLRRVTMDEVGRHGHEQELVARTREGIEWFYA